MRAWIHRFKGRRAIAERVRSGEASIVASSAHYQHVHDTFKPYQENNWLVPDAPRILTFSRGSLCELGCGNGRFLKLVASHYNFVCGIDWACSPLLEPLPRNVSFVQADLSLKFPLSDKFDVVCSADFLEHLELSAITKLLASISSQAAINYHKIACYDDGGSHLTLLSPAQWLSLFRAVDKDYRIESMEMRRGDSRQEVVTISNSPRSL
jgi:SAM-dependent methyltransferase